jgi:hypothetical protein
MSKIRFPFNLSDGLRSLLFAGDVCFFSVYAAADEFGGVVLGGAVVTVLPEAGSDCGDLFT